jgi:hypothetical protein
VLTIQGFFHDNVLTTAKICNMFGILNMNFRSHDQFIWFGFRYGDQLKLTSAAAIISMLRYEKFSMLFYSILTNEGTVSHNFRTAFFFLNKLNKTGYSSFTCGFEFAEKFEKIDRNDRLLRSQCDRGSWLLRFQWDRVSRFSGLDEPAEAIIGSQVQRDTIAKTNTVHMQTLHTTKLLTLEKGHARYFFLNFFIHYTEKIQKVSKKNISWSKHIRQWI